jgi:endonuclease/exonuclease/phosphatase (EEP) superfamily protein YafD
MQRAKKITTGHILITFALIGLITPLLTDLMVNSNGVLAWLVDLAAHWQWLYLLLLMVGMSLLAIQDRRYLGLLLITPLPWLTASDTAPEIDHTPRALKVAIANVNLNNQSSAGLREWLAEKQPDIVALVELSPEFAVDLQPLKGYPHRAIYPENSPFGLGILSQHALSDVELKRHAHRIPHMQAKVAWNNRLIRLVVFHPMPPLTPAFHAERNQKIRDLIQEHNKQDLPTIIAGDFNATPWSSAFTGLKDRGFRRATGLNPTWPSVAYGMIGIPIDHVLLSKHWLLVESEKGPPNGSDHIPALVHIDLDSLIPLYNW